MEIHKVHRSRPEFDEIMEAESLGGRGIEGSIRNEE
jgi:hypothetical protein